MLRLRPINLLELFRFKGTEAVTRAKPKTVLPPTGMHRSPYAIFMKDQYQNDNNNLLNGKISFAERSKVITAKWKNLSEIEKKKYYDDAAKFKAAKIKEFEELSDDEKELRVEASREEKAIRAKRRVRKERREMWEATGRPRLPGTAYTLFVKDRFDHFKKVGKDVSNLADLTREVAQAWKNLSESESKKYHDLSERKREEYKIELQKWIKLQSENKVDNKKNVAISNA